MKKGLERGFTLTEILLVLGLLGLIATFAIPKVLQAQGNQEAAAKVKETIAMLEQAWSEMKTQNSYTVGSPLYNSLVGSFNDLSTDPGPASPILGADHPCADLEGYFELVNNVVITGLSAAGADSPNLRESVFPQTYPEPSNYLLCIDINGANAPNTVGTDIFGGNFNQSGDFDGPGSYFEYEEDNENFNWGGKTATDDIYPTGTSGTVPAAPFDTINSRAGTLLY